MKKTLASLFLALSLSGLMAANVTVIILDGDLGIPLEGVRLEAKGLAPAATGPDGRALVSIPDGGGRVAVTASLPGYQTARLWLDPKAGEITFKLAIAVVVEGKELVVEKARPQKTDEESGVSEVATREDIKNTGEIGVVEDLMSTIKLMPGVGYVGGWNALPSIRGGDPLETTAVLDGAYVLNPYEWGGAYSIFDPNMVESAKLSNGLISARYGRVLSGLLEVASKTPKASRPQVDFGVSTTGLDLYAQDSFGPSLDLMLGGKLTWMEVPFALVGETGTFDPVPYIRNGYARLDWRPSDRAECFLNSFINSDGVGEKMDSPAGASGIATKGLFTWDELNLIETGGVKLLVSDSSLLSLVASYNRNATTLRLSETLNGTHQYDQGFIDTYSGLLGGATAYTLNDFDFAELGTDSIDQTYQARASWDWEFAKGQVLSFGAESVLEEKSYKTDQMIWEDVFTPAGPLLFERLKFSRDDPANKELESGAFALCEFNLFSGLLAGEAGLRVDDDYLFSDQMSIKTYPTVDPRLRVELTPWKNLGWVRSLGITAGSGLYSQLASISSLFDPSMDIPDYSVSPTRAWFNVLGLDLRGEDDWKISLEGYYKYYFDRLYVVLDSSGPSVKPIIQGDGTGYAFGADLLVQKRLGRFWDGWLSYSFCMTRDRNPYSPTYGGQLTNSGDPLGIWYYPSYQRFHTLYAVLDWKPKPGFSVTVTGSLATGAPRQEVGAVQSYPTVYTDPTTGKTEVIERYSRSSSYSDSLRNDLSCPVDLKLAWSDYYAGTKIRWEYYFGLENLFAYWYSPKSNKAFDPFTGSELSGSGSADFTIGFPIPSFGYKLSY